MKALGKLSGLLIAGVACLAPLPYGSDAYGWVCIWLGILAACVLLQAWILPPPASKVFVTTVTALGLALLCLTMLQTSTSVPQALQHPAWRVAAENGIADASGRIAVDAVAPIYALAYPLATLMALLAGYFQAYRRPWCWLILKALVISGSIHALIGILVSIANPGHVLFAQKIAYQNDFTGTFVNRNTAAAYFGVCLLAAATIAFRAWQQNWPAGYLPIKEKFLFLLQNLTSVTGFWTMSAAAFLVAVLLTGSRAGTASCIVAAATLLLLLVRKVGRAGRGVLIAATAAAAIFILELFGTGTILTRVSEGFNENGRYGAWSSSLDIVKDFPLFGTGLGTFMAAFPSYRRDDLGIMQVWERAHNTPLELAVELGLPAAAVLVAAWGFGLAMLFRACRKATDAPAVPALAVSIMLLVGIHSLVDFPMQVSGCGIPIAIVLGAVFRQGLASNERKAVPDQIMGNNPI